MISGAGREEEREGVRELSKGLDIAPEWPLLSLHIESIFEYHNAIEDLNLGRN
jgi:hypothetical protein